MRIISGEFGGRRLKAVPGVKTRPTTDKVKESIFNIIGPYFDGGIALDLYAGSGGLAIEAVSRGMESAILVDRQYAAINVIHENIAITKNLEAFKVVKSDAFKFLDSYTGKQFRLVLLDPPYKQQQMVKILTLLDEQSLLEDGACLVCETDTAIDYPEHIIHFSQTRQQRYGITEVTIFRYEKSED